MIVDPIELMKTTTLLPVPTTSTAPPHTPLPTVIPDLPEFQKASGTGHKTLWVIFVLMVLSSAAFAAMSWAVPISKRLYHVNTTLITVIAALSYFAMATGQGISFNKTTVVEEHDHVPDTSHSVYRQVYFARYIDWALTTPLILLNLSFLAGLGGAHILIAVVADFIMILTGLFAAFGTEGTPQKWGWFAIACLSYLVIVWHLAVNGRARAFTKSKGVGTIYSSIAAYAVLVWTVYPIIWAAAGGARVLSVNSEIIAYAVLDLLAKPVFGFWLLLTYRRTPETNVDLGGFWTYGLNQEGRLRLAEENGA